MDVHRLRRVEDGHSRYRYRGPGLSRSVSDFVRNIKETMLWALPTFLYERDAPSI